MRTFYSYQYDQIPDRAGIYSFYYNPYNYQGLGLYKDRTIGGRDLSRAKSTLRKKLKRLRYLKSSLNADISINLRAPSGISVAEFDNDIAATFIHIDDDLDELSTHEFMELLELANNSIHTFPIIYCGITIEQTLKSRYTQHYSNFKNERTATFGGRARQFLLDWHDLAYSCVPSDSLSGFRSAARKLERQIIDFSVPLLSNR